MMKENQMVSLDTIAVGDSAWVRQIKVSMESKRRLLDLGLTCDMVICCVGTSACGDPRAFLVRGAVIALRQEDCAKILVEPRAKE